MNFVGFWRFFLVFCGFGLVLMVFDTVSVQNRSDTMCDLYPSAPCATAPMLLHELGAVHSLPRGSAPSRPGRAQGADELIVIAHVPDPGITMEFLKLNTPNFTRKP